MEIVSAMRQVLPALVIAIFALPTGSFAQSYPARPIRLIVPFAPGGATDIVARMLADRLTESFSQQVIVDNRGGAGGAIGTEIAARASPDGYTLGIGHVGTLAMNPTLRPKLPYNPVKDLVPISLIAMMPNALVVSASFQAKSVQDLITMAKARPDTILYGSAGNGSSNHLGIVYLELLTNTKFRHVAYKGGGPATVDLIAGNISVMMPGMPPVIAHIKSNRLRLLAVSSQRRVPIFPKVPTLAEAGVTGYEYTNWMGVFGPTGIPHEIVSRLNAEVVKAAGSAGFVKRLAVEGGISRSSTPAEFGAHIRSEIARWAPIIKASGAQVE